MRYSASSVIAALILMNCVTAQKSAAHDLDLRSAWFTPFMAVNADPICETMLSDVRDHFRSFDGWDSSSSGAGEYFTKLKKIPGPFANGMGLEPTVQPSDSDPRSFVIIGPDGKRLYAYFQTNPGCGGACETSQLEISENPFPEDHFRKSDSNESQIASTPASFTWTLYKSTTGAHYVIGVVDNHLHAYLIAAPRNWRKSCDIALAPDRLRESTDPAVQMALKSLKELNAAVLGLTGGEGYSCGSSHTTSRWNGYIAEALEQTLYRPWALRESDENARQSENSYGDYSRIIGQLKLWSLGGLSEHQAFAAYEEKLSQTRKELGRFYGKKFGWSSDVSDGVAKVALEFAVSRGMGFYMYTPYPAPAEAELRAAILEHRPLHDIQAIRVDKATMTGVLDAAVQYPEALRYLLAQGANANLVNEFGKTPLMYAAQYDQYESAKLLLASGADPNAATTWATDTCTYALQTARMTPLHYAVRYASPKTIRLLLDNGASTFSKTETQIKQGEYPIDWLKRYTDPAVPERNANIPDAEIPKLVELLRVPGAAELAALSADLTRRAEADYAKGRVEKSYRELMAALSAQPDNEKALMDLPIVALRSGRPGLSLKAADAVLMKSKNAAILASAWFNKGLVCEQNGFKPITYDGWYYCMDDPVRPFLQAWKLAHTESRREKVEKLLRDESPRTCTIQKAGSTAQRYRFESGREDEYKDRRNVMRIYAYHESAQTIDPVNLKWTVQQQDRVNKGSMKTTISPNVVERHDLGQFAITELKIDFMPSGPLWIGDQPCTFYK